MWDGAWKHVCLSDSPIPETPPWEIRLVTPKSDDTRREARRLKVLSHRYFPKAEYILFHDGNIRFNMDRPLRWLKQHDMALCAHPERDCIYEEAEICIKSRKDNEGIIRAQMARYKEGGYPENAGLVATTVLLRRHTEAVRRFNERWWEEISKGSVRDQLSFNYVCREFGMGYDIIPGHVFHNQRFEYFFPHGQDGRKL